MDVLATAFELFAVEDEFVGETELPESSPHAASEPALEVLHGFWEVLGLDDQMDVVRHHDEGEEFVGAFATIVLQRLHEKARGSVDPEAAAATEDIRRNEECARSSGPGRPSHG